MFGVRRMGRVEAIMKSILLLVHDDVGQEARLQVALDVILDHRGNKRLRINEPVSRPTRWGFSWVSRAPFHCITGDLKRTLQKAKVTPHQRVFEKRRWIAPSSGFMA
jgi:hypothetical protein